MRASFDVLRSPGCVIVTAELVEEAAAAGAVSAELVERMAAAQAVLRPAFAGVTPVVVHRDLGLRNVLLGPGPPYEAPVSYL